MAGDLNGRQIAARVGASLLANWCFCFGFVMAGTVLLSRTGLDFGDARTAALLLAFPIYLIAFLWAFVAASVTRVWAALIGSGALLTGLGWLMRQSA